MKPTRSRIRKIALVTSVALNLFVAVPALVVFFLSGGIRFYLYEMVADRAGDTDIAFIGDSITRDGKIWGLRIGRPLLEVRNLAHAALYTEQMTYQAQIAVAQKARLAFVMAGINDVPKSLGGAETSFQAYLRILEILREGGVTPVIQSTLYREDGSDEEFVSELNSLLIQYSKENGIAFLDVNGILSSEGRLRSEFSRDGTHLTEKAYAAWSQEIRKFLEEGGY